MIYPLVSVTVTTKNEEKHIGGCLESLENQTYPAEAVEIIVVDNNSIDRTKEIARKYTDKVFNKGPERSAQRNFGMLERSKGKYLMFLDADMSLSPDLIAKAVKKLEKSDLTALYIPEIVTGNSYWAKVRNFERSFYDGTVIDCARIIRSDVFRQISGFDESLTGPEDWDLDKRIRQISKTAVLEGAYPPSQKTTAHSWAVDKCRFLLRRISALPKEEKIPRHAKRGVELHIYHNESDFSLKKYLAKKSYYSKSFDTYIQKWGKNDSDIKKQFSFGYRLFGVFAEQEKWKRLLAKPELTFGVYFLRFLVGVEYLKSKR